MPIQFMAGPQDNLRQHQLLADLPDANRPGVTPRGLGGPPIKAPLLDDGEAQRAVMTAEPGGLALPGQAVFPGTRSVVMSHPSRQAAVDQFMDSNRAGIDLQRDTMAMGGLAQTVAGAGEAQKRNDLVRGLQAGGTPVDRTGALADAQALEAANFSRRYRHGLMGESGRAALDHAVTTMAQMPPHLQRRMG